MNPFSVTLMALVAGTSEMAGEPIPTDGLTVCVARKTSGELVRAFGMAQYVAGKIYAGIGVNVIWRTIGKDCPDGALEVTWSTQTDPDVLPHSLAYSQPFEGRAIVVFYDRVKRMTETGTVPRLLGHVLAHEIGHMIQGTDGHSENGVMKARWEGADYQKMDHAPLTFSDVDASRIRRGLMNRQTGLAKQSANPVR